MFLKVNFVSGQLKADFDASETSGCLPVPVVLKDKSSGNPDRWHWSFGDGRTSSLKNPSLLYLVKGTYTIKLTVYKGLNDSSSSEQTINIYEYPTSKFQATNVVGCIPLKVNFQNRSIAGSGNIKSYYWDFGDGFSSTAANPTHSYLGPGNYTVTLTVENQYGCKNSSTIADLVEVFDTVQSNFSVVMAPSCGAPFTVKFNNGSTGKITQHTWSFGDGQTSADVDVEHTYNVGGNYKVMLIVQNEKGCADTSYKDLNLVSGDFKAAFNAPAQVCKGTKVNFENASTPANMRDSVFWDFGDGTFSKSLSPTKAFASPGTYSVKLTVFFRSCQVTTSHDITILPGPVTNFSAFPTEACKPPLQVNFTNLTTDGTVVRWNLGNGMRPPTNNPVATYDSFGTYTVSLVTVGLNGCRDTLVKPDLIKVQPPQLMGFPGLPYSGCFPWTHTFKPDIVTNTPIVKWEWDFGDGRTSNDSFPTITFSQRGRYKIKLKVTTQSGCVDSLSSTVEGGFTPDVNFSATPLFVCPSDFVSFTGQVTGNYDSLRWEFGDGGVMIDIIDPMYRYKDTGYMTVKFFAWDHGCVDSLMIINYIYVTPPYAKFGVEMDCGKPYERQFLDSSIGATEWYWDFGNGDTSRAQSPLYVYPAPGRYGVTLTVSDGKCYHQTSTTVLVLDEKPEIEMAESNSCAENNVTFKASGSQLNYKNIQNYTWRFSDGVNFFNSTSTIQRTFNKNTSVSLRLAVVDLNGCSRVVNRSFNLYIGGPKARIIPATRLACLGSTVVFADSSQSNPTSKIVSWKWDYGNGVVKTYSSPPFENVYQDTGYYDLKLRVEDVNGCADSISVKRGVGVFQPIAAFYSPDTVVCVNGDVEFINVSKGTGLVYKWNLGENDNYTSRDVVKKYKKPGYYDIGLEITDTAKCKSVELKKKYILVGNAIADFSMSDSFASCPPLLVKFTDKSINAIQYHWDFDNGNSSALKDPIQTYTGIGEYKAKLIVTGNGGCKDSVIRKVLIRGPQGVITYSPLNGCPPLEVKFTASATNVKTFIWDFSDGNTQFSTDSVATYTYLTPGTFRPRVILEDGANCRIPIIGPKDIKIVGVRSLIKELKSYVYCDSARIAFGDSSITNDAIRRWKWDFGDGDTSNLPNPVHFYKNPGKYKVSLYVETFDNCNSFYALPGEVNIVASPRLSGLKDTTFCLPGKVLFKVHQQTVGAGTLTWNWDFGNGLTSNLPAPDSILYEKPGVFSPRVIVANEFGCKDNLTSRITVYESAETYIVNVGSYKYCNMGTVQFKDSSTNASIIKRWEWDFGDGNTSSQRNPVHQFSKPGRYTVSLSVFTDRNCVTTQILPGQIVIAPTPEMDLLIDTAKCLPAKIGFSPLWLNADSTSLNYQWDFGNGMVSNKRVPDSVLYSNYGKYIVRLTTTNEYGCSDSISKEIRINDLPKVLVGGINPGIICDSGMVRFEGNLVSNDPISSWTWSFGDGETSTVQNPTHIYKKKGVYKVSLTVSTIHNCTSTASFVGDLVVVGSPKIKLIGTPEICVPDTASFEALWVNGDNRGMQWEWAFGNGATSTRQYPEKVWFRTPGTYNIVAIAKDEYGCRDSLGLQLVAKDTPRLVIDAVDVTCLGSSVNLKAAGAESIIWKPDPSLSCYNCANPIATPRATTTYTVMGRNGSLAGCERQKSVTVNVVQPLSILASKGDSICVGESYQLRATGGAHYSWSPADGLSSASIPNPVASPQQTTNYMVVATDANKCFKDTAFVPIVVFERPTVKIKEDLIKGFMGTAVTLQTEFTNVTRWRWTPSVGLSCVACPQPQLVITQPITYQVHVTNPGGCEATDEVVVEPICATDQVFVPNTFSPNGDGRNDLFYPMGRGVSAIKSLRVFNRWGEVVFERINFMANDPTAGWNGTYKGRTLSPDVYVYVMVVLCYNNQSVEMKGNVTLLQ